MSVQTGCTRLYTQGIQYLQGFVVECTNGVYTPGGKVSRECTRCTGVYKTPVRVHSEMRRKTCKHSEVESGGERWTNLFLRSFKRPADVSGGFRGSGNIPSDAYSSIAEIPSWRPNKAMYFLVWYIQVSDVNNVALRGSIDA